MSELKGIISISGKPGLHKVLSNTKNGFIVESLLDGKKFPAFNSNKISSLEDIAIFTMAGEVKLEEVFKSIFDKEEGSKAISPKVSTNELKIYFEEILPDYDQDRVYVSDMKKVLQWYNLLVENDLLKFEHNSEEEEAKEEKSEESDAKNDAKKAVKSEKNNKPEVKEQSSKSEKK